MSTNDISRYLFQPEKRYVGARMQQGRIITDDDLNAHRQLHSEDARRTIAEIVCSKGTPNNGFRIENAIAEDDYNFSIGAGSFYLGGQRFEMEGERFLKQRDWLQINAKPLDGEPAKVPPLPTAARTDLVFLRGWEQCVGAVEDGELIEHALGGPDTSTFVRRMRRVEVFPLSDDFQGGCAEAFGELVDSLNDDDSDNPKLVSMDPSSCEILSNVRLTVDFGDEETEDPCQPKVTQGFIGAENQAIRVQLTGANRFVWGYDNASPLYKVKAVTDPSTGKLQGINFLTQPRDQLSQPTTDHVVEILPWSARLPNDEIVAARQGHLTQITRSFDPDPAVPDLILKDEVPGALRDWFADNEIKSDEQYFYLRVWTGGPPEGSVSPDHEFDPDQTTDPVSLPGTGLRLKFSQLGRSGDYWIISARPNTPSQLVPWELVLSSAPPVGPREFLAPLALIDWAQAHDQTLVPTVRDCRHKFRSLCQTSCCCTLIVGDGVTSHGDFDSIQEAIDHLLDEGGEICLLPGLHRTNAIIQNRRDIRIKGCDKQTRVAPLRDNSQVPVFTIIDSSCISLEHMDIVSLGGTGIALEETLNGILEEIFIAHNRIVSCVHAIRVDGGSDIHIYWNKLRLLDREEGLEAILIRAEDSLIERNDIGIRPAPREPGGDRVPPPERNPEDPCAEPEIFLGSLFLLNRLLTAVFLPLPNLAVLIVNIFRPFRALGGIRIAMGSRAVKVLENRITGGAGNGVTLGGILRVVEEESEDEIIILSVPPDLKSINARVAGGAKNVEGLVLRFQRTDDSKRVIEAETDAAGTVVLEAEAGEYQVSSLSSGLRVRGVREQSLGEFGVRHDLTFGDFVANPGTGIGWVYDAVIEGNSIEAMDLSGIGSPLEASSLVSVFGGGNGRLSQARFERANLPNGHPVIGVRIIANSISGCLRRPFDDELRELVQMRGLGGISLDLAAALTISENTIAGNGRDHLDPVCGIFIGVGDQLEIHRNEIVDNGEIRETTSEPRVGLRGGIVVGVSVRLFPAAGRQGFFREYSARIHDNIVRHPVGHALLLGGVGPMSIDANRFHSLRSAPGGLGFVTATILVINMGTGRKLPSGCTNFNGNQVLAGEGATSLFNVGILTADDLGFDANQIESLNKGFELPANDNLTFAILINALLIGDSLRASDSRFKEPDAIINRDNDFGRIDALASLLSMTRTMNNTVSNQGDHCVFARSQMGAGLIRDALNQILDSRLCPEKGRATKNLFDTFMDNRTIGSVLQADQASGLQSRIEVDGDERVIEASLAEPLARLSSAEIQVASTLVQANAEVRAHVQHEAVRINQIYGDQDVRLASYEAHLSERTAVTRALSENAEFAEIKVARVEDGGMRVRGRIADASDRGIARLQTCLVDLDGRSVQGIDLVLTASTGYYEHVLSADDVGRLADGQSDGVRLAVFSPRGRELFTDKQSFLIEPDRVRTISVGLDRENDFQVINPGKPGTPSPTEPKPIRVMVPDFVSPTQVPITLADARAALTRLKLKIEISPPEAGSKSIVVGQNPGPGELVVAGSTVTLRVRPISDGPERTKIPSVEGLPFPQARKTLEEKEKLTVGTILGDFDNPDKVDPQAIVRNQFPLEGADVPVGSSVNLLVKKIDTEPFPDGSIENLVELATLDPEFEQIENLASTLLGKLRAEEIEDSRALEIALEASDQELRDRFKLVPLKRTRAFRSVMERVLSR